MPYFRLADHVPVDPLLQFTVCFCLSFVLTEIFCPRMDQEYLQVAMRDLDIAINAPSIRAIPTATLTRMTSAVVLNRRSRVIVTIAVPKITTPVQTINSVEKRARGTRDDICGDDASIRLRPEFKKKHEDIYRDNECSDDRQSRRTARSIAEWYQSSHTNLH